MPFTGSDMSLRKQICLNFMGVWETVLEANKKGQNNTLTLILVYIPLSQISLSKTVEKNNVKSHCVDADMLGWIQQCLTLHVLHEERKLNKAELSRVEIH